MNRRHLHYAVIEGAHHDLMIEFWLSPQDHEDFDILHANMAGSERELLPAIKRHPQWLKMVTDRVVAQIQENA